MTRDESLDVVAMISNHWPGNQWTTESLDAYAKAIVWMDAALAMKAVVHAVQKLSYYPKVADLREFYAIEKRMAEPDTPIERMLNDTPTQIMPQWIGGWCISRVRHKDMRVWPEQSKFLDGEPMPREACDAYIKEAVGQPIQALFRKMTAGVGMEVD